MIFINKVRNVGFCIIIYYICYCMKCIYNISKSVLTLFFALSLMLFYSCEKGELPVPAKSSADEDNVELELRTSDDGDEGDVIIEDGEGDGNNGVEGGGDPPPGGGVVGGDDDDDDDDGDDDDGTGVVGGDDDDDDDDGDDLV